MRTVYYISPEHMFHEEAIYYPGNGDICYATTEENRGDICYARIMTKRGMEDIPFNKYDRVLYVPAEYIGEYCFQGKPRGKGIKKIVFVETVPTKNNDKSISGIYYDEYMDSVLSRRPSVIIDGVEEGEILVAYSEKKGEEERMLGFVVFKGKAIKIDIANDYYPILPYYVPFYAYGDRAYRKIKTIKSH